ncbi:MAG: hypothetical protein NXY57DRAFT_875562, partial [Lentinula lateritia]
DFHQFPPVGNGTGALYMEQCKNWFAVQGRDIYQSFNKAVILTNQMRVRDERWMALLNRLHTGSCNEDDIDKLHKLRLDLKRNPATDFTDAGWATATLITPRNAARKRWNAAALWRHCHSKGTRLYSCPAEDTIGGAPLSPAQRMMVAHKKVKETGNLPHRVELAVGMKAMVVLNIATEADLANGTRGTIMKIVLDDRE